jgi:hypothetical protein
MVARESQPKSPTKQALQDELDEAYDRIESLESYIASGQSLIEENEDEDDEEE